MKVKVEVEVDIDDILENFEDDIVISELKNRGYLLAEEAEGEDNDRDVCELRVLIEHKDWLNAMAMFDRTFDVDGSRK